MAKYTVRIVLHEATYEHYESLHDEMLQKLQALRQVKGENGVWYDLPDAEYDVSSKLGKKELCDAVYGIAESVKASPSPSVLVTKSAGRSWRLRKVPDES